MYVTHLESALDGTRFEAGTILTVHQGRPLWVRYDLPAIQREVPRPGKSGLGQGDTSLWRYRQLLPLPRGASLFPVNGLIPDWPRLVREGAERMSWFDTSTLKEPYRLEGKKTMGLELAEQFCWALPDVVLYPTGGGTGLIGMWKAFQELQ